MAAGSLGSLRPRKTLQARVGVALGDSGTLPGEGTSTSVHGCVCSRGAHLSLVCLTPSPVHSGCDTGGVGNRRLE